MKNVRVAQIDEDAVVDALRALESYAETLGGDAQSIAALSGGI